MRHLTLAVAVLILMSTSLIAQNNRSAVSLTENDAATCTVPVNGNTGLPSSASIDHALMEKNGTDGLLVDNATVEIRNSVASGNGVVGVWADASTGSTADVSADNYQAIRDITGLYAGTGPGTSKLMVSNSVDPSNTNVGIAVNDVGIVRASNNTVTANSIGFGQFNTGIFRSRGNNTVDGNPSPSVGTIAPFSAM